MMENKLLKSTILSGLVEKKNEKTMQVKAKIPEELKNKISFICESTDVKEDEYLGKLLESSEINKVYLSLKKEKKTENE